MPSLLERVQTVKDTEYFVKLLLYGPYGSGKTRFCGYAPNPVWIDVERSTETFRNIPELADTKLFVPLSFEEMFQFCRDVVRQKAYETIVIDTIGRTQDNQVMDLVKKGVQKSGGKREAYLPLWGDYRVSTYMLDEMFVFLQAAPIHVCIIAHEKVYLDPDTGAVTRITPDLTPTLRKSIAGLINVMGYLDLTTDIGGNRERKLYLNPINKIEAKNRLNIQETSIKNPTFNEVFLK